MKNKELQLELDIKKWMESEAAGKDLCGTYSFCEYCEKDLDNPCAEAYNLALEDASSEDEAAEEVVEEVVNEDGTVTVTVKRKVLTFAEKLAKAKDETKEKYAQLKALVEANGFTAFMLKRYVIVRYHGVVSAKITLTRNSLKMHMALNPSTFEKYTHMDYSHFKCYQAVPFTVKYDTKKSFKDTEALLPKLVKKASKQLNK